MYTSGSLLSGRLGRLIAALAVTALSCAAQTPSLTTLYSFTGGANGANPSAALVFGGGKHSADLFGTTPYGGTAGTGTVFQLTPGTTWTQTVIYNFQGGTDGANPVSSLVTSPDGILYGTTQAGGLTGNGTVFELKPTTTKGGEWTETILYNFAGASAGTINTAGTIVTQTEGTAPFVTGSAWAGLPFTITFDTTSTVYTIASVQSATQLTLTTSAGNQTGVNYSINDGGEPLGNVIRLSNNKLYGTTFGGGTNGAGTAFQLTPPATSGPWTEEVIYNFGGGEGKDGSGPQSGLLVSKGDLYGSTCCGTNGGTVFKLSPGKSGWAETMLHPFTAYNTGYAPYGGLAEDANGVIYGTTVEGGTAGYGTIFSLTPEPKGGYKLATIHSFSNGADGGSPYGGLLLGTGGVLYATVTSGCEYGVGGVLEFTPPSGSGDWTETVLYSFTGGADGSQPFGGVISDSKGNWYGTTAFSNDGSGYGTVFELTP